MKESTTYKGGFPIGVFPPFIQEVIKATNEAYNFPVQYTAASILSAVSTAIGTSCSLHINNGWEETAILFVAIVGNPGSCKSHPISFALEPIIQRNLQYREEFSSAYRGYRKALQEGNQEGALQKPVCSQRIVQDVTTEELLAIHEKNPIGICFYADELALWFTQMVRYKKASSDVGYWLSFFNGRPVIVDRKSTDEKLTLKRTFVNVIGSIQPEVLKKYLMGENRENGLLSRIMIIYGDENEEMPYDSTTDMPSEMTEKYNELILGLLDASEASRELTDVTYNLSDSSKAVYDRWSRATTDVVNDKEPMEMCEFFSKIKNYVFRMALILQVLYETCEKRSSNLYIEEDIMRKACVIGDYLMDSARHTISSFIVESKISPGYRSIYEKLPEGEFKKSVVNDIIYELDFSESLADKFCKDMRGIMIERIKFATYRKIKI